MRGTLPELVDPQVVHHFGLEVEGINEASFREASGFETSNDVIENRESGPDGKQFISKQPGNLKWGDITLKRGMTDSKALYEWRKLVIDGKHKQARKNGSVIFYDAENGEIARFNFVRGWPSKWKGPDVNTTNNAVAVEEITIAHEGWDRVK
jgi:phage tail-like protein